MRRVILLVLAASVVVCGCRSTPETNDRAEVNRLLKLLDSPDEGTRMRAAAVLVSLEGEVARKAITRRLHRSTEPEVRAALALALEVRPREEFLTQLITMLSDPDDAVAPAAAKALTAYDYDLIAKPLLGIATDRVAPERARRFAIEILGRTGRAEVVPTLIELFGEEKLHDDVVAGLKHVTRQDLDELQQWRYWWDANKDRTQAQWYAGKIDELKRRIALLESQLKAEQALRKQLADRFADAAIDALKSRPNKDNATPLIAALDDVFPKVRRYAAEELARLKAPAAVEKLSDVVVNDSDPGTRAAAARALGEIDDLKAESALGKALESKDESVAVAAASALGRLEAEGSVNRLMIALLREDSGPLRAAAATALGEIGKTDAIPPLLKLLTGDPEEDVRAAAAGALGQIGDGRAYAALDLALEDKGPRVRVFAVKAIGMLNDPRTSPRLCTLLEKEINPSVREAAVVTLGAAGDAKSVDALMGVLLDTRPNEQKLREWAFRSIQAVAARLGDLTEPTGDALVKAGRLEEAVKLYEQRIEQLTQAGGEEAKLPAVRRKLLDAHLTLKQFANALPVLRELTKTFPDDTTLLKTLARTLREVKSFAETFRTYGVLAAKDKQGNYWSERLALLDAMLVEKQFAEVVRLAEEVLTGEAQPPEALKREFEVRRKQAADAVDAVRQERLLEVRRLIVELADESEDVRKAARAKLMATKEEALPRLVEALDAPEARQRKTAVELLRELSGVAFGFKPEARPEENTEALAKWKEWLKTRTPR